VKTAGCGSTTAPKSGTYNISVDGLSRSYILKLPDNYDANKPYRLLLLFHPLGGTAADVAMNWHNLPALANNSMIFVAPDGISKGWADAGTTATQPGRDMQFTKTLVNDLSGKLCVDKTRIFAEGFSFGAAMSYAVACAMGDVVRGVVVIAGAKLSGCVQHTKPVAYLMIHGTSDSTLRYPGAGLPLLNDFAKVNGCTPQPIPDPRNSQFACVDYTGCMPGYPARGCLWPGGHTWKAPGTWLPEQAWKFISQF
jgi:poly(3-hydroxybutyrate) depolymerase